MAPPLRVALFTDSFQEANGVATLSQEYAKHAQRHDIPFCCVYGSNETKSETAGSLQTLQLKRGPASFSLGNDLRCDPLLNRHRNHVIRQLQTFRPDLIHITGPGDLGILGFWVAHCLRIPLVASWHTNLHEYLGRRLRNAARVCPATLRNGTANVIERQSLKALLRFYRLAHFVMAPNQAMVDFLSVETGRPSYLMTHGVDVTRFSPEKRASTDHKHFCIGYVGRLCPEKNVTAFVDLEQQLLAAGQRNFRLLLVGEGNQRQWLEKNLKFAELPGVLRGERLAAAFAGMDVFVFPSQTDTYGLVLLEAMASGVPVVITPEASAHANLDELCGAMSGNDFVESLLTLMRSPELRQSLGSKARKAACSRIWSEVFEKLYDTFGQALREPDVLARIKPATNAAAG